MTEQSLGAGVEVVRSQNQGSFLEVLWTATRLGLTSFGGPIAHLGYFHEEYVKRRKWIDEQSYADLVALCQFLAGPASSQVSIAIGIARAGLPGGFAAWLGFTLPSALALITFAFGIGAFANAADAGWLHGLKVVAVAVVAQAVWGMARSLCPDRERATLAILASIVTLAWPTALGSFHPSRLRGLLAQSFFPRWSLLLHSRTCGFQLKKEQELWLGLSSLHFSLGYRSCDK
jgi:chromate transporter